MAIRTLPPPPLATLDRPTLRAYFEDSWRIYELLFSALTDDAYLQQPDPLRHPLIFYFGHTAAFYVNKLVLAGLRDGPLDPELDELFAKGVDPDRPEHLRAFSWPTVERARRYRDAARAVVLQAIEEVPLTQPITPQSPVWALLMGCEHDRIHFETSSVLFRQLDLAYLRRPEGWSYAPTPGAPDPARRIRVPAQEVVLGQPDQPRFYGWDNEYGRRSHKVAAFTVDHRLISNQELLAFVADGGYRQRALWTDDGWAWRERVGAHAPKFWSLADDSDPSNGDIDRYRSASAWRYRAMFDRLPLPLSWPAEVNCHEARAWCRWRGEGASLPTEAEFAALSADAPLHQGDCVSAPGYNLALRFGSPSPVGWFEQGVSPLGLTDVYGNVWQWLADDFAPLPGFEAHPLYDDFSAPYFDDQHATLKGGAWATSGTGSSRYYRLWFRRHFFQHAGFRVAWRDAS